MAKKISNPKVRKIVFEKFDGHCAYCGCQLGNRFHIDHLIPKRRNSNYVFHTNYYLEKGKDVIENFMPSCHSCNSCKSDLSLEDFRERIQNRITRLKDYSTEYNIAKRFGLIKEIGVEVIFYFEKNFKIVPCQELEA